MAHAQIELYPSSKTPVVDENGELIREEPVPPWGWRKTVFVDPPEVIEDSGPVFQDRAAAMTAAAESNPHWPIG